MAKEQQVASDDLTALKGQVAKAEAGEAAATQRAETAEQQNARLNEALGAERASRVAADELAAANALAAAENQAAIAETKIAEAGAKGDWSALAKAQRELADAQMSKRGWEQQAKRISNYKKAVLAGGGVQRTEQVQPGNEDPLAQYTPRTQAWLRAHPEVLASKQKTALAVSAHFEAEAEGIQPDTPEYFARLESKLGITQSGDEGRSATGAKVDEPLSAAGQIEVDTMEEVETERRPEEKRQQQSAAMAAAPTRRNPPTTERKAIDGGKVRLTPSEQEAARFSYPHLKTDEERYREYAKNKVALVNEGRLTQ